MDQVLSQAWDDDGRCGKIKDEDYKVAVFPSALRKE